MITKTLLVTNVEELEQAKEAGYSIKEEKEFFDFWFDPKDIKFAYVNYAGNINLDFGDDYYTVPDNKEIRDMLNNKFK